ncbi:protein translocase subunit SecF [Pseudoramibacter sp.]|jgi:preprotein translocase subunit SecF|uniref:protein translocase subunit SecF n=1 Tax=Pseudoramibacter sp. TaxID=2034862 RepID=UPI0025D230D3|nr:protein translocase subunit SecF [Pseudoramibacter sp.]MCH4072767.1 protein translocase subunit SecF [Pseudoramibacter sp.]MCH4106538.1 protein translocase subunit SecF [Pseudoramibacter sp.]
MNENLRKKLPIIEHTKVWLSISLILIVIAVGATLIRGLNYGIDFVGGSVITIDLHQTFDTKDIKKITDSFDKSADITYTGKQKHEVVISTKASLNNRQQKKLFSKFQTKYHLDKKDLVSVENITASVGAETSRNTIIASIVAVVLMLVYITIRFEFYFGLSAVLALVHDIVIVIGVYALFQIQVNSPFIAAILTILGYSINDTIVVFDRIRENEGLLGISTEAELDNLVDISITQTMRRSINTVATTLVAIVALYIFAVDAIRDFALPLIVGIASGCYSSIFVASPLWVIFQKKSARSKFNSTSQKRRNRQRSKRRHVEKIEV